MAILFAESFDGYANTAGMVAALQTVSNDADYSTTRGRWGGGALNGLTFDAGAVRNITAPGSNLLRWAFHFKGNRNAVYSFSGARVLFGFTNAAANRWIHCGVTGNFGGSIASGLAQTYLYITRFDDQQSIAIAAATTVPVSDGNWHHIEVEFVAHATTGSIKIWIDGVQNVNINNIDTSDAASGDVTSLNRVIFGGGHANGGASIDTLTDDVLVWDDSGSDFTGHLTSPHRLRNCLVNAAGDSAQFTPNTGANDAAVDDATFDDNTTYVESSTVGHIDLYNVGAISGTGLGTIRAVIVETIGKDTAAVATHRAKLKSNGTTADGTTSAAMANAYRKYQHIFFKDPDGAIDWTQSKVEASQTGQEVMS